MKTKFSGLKSGILILTILVLATAFARAQTNNLTALLQQGLMEEQANRDLNAAISNYQSLATQFDKDRQLAATAIFRLGECYRMLNKTNEAAQEYRRIINEFSDQTTLATLSRQDLAGMGMPESPTVSSVRQRQIELLEKQIALAQQNLAAVQEKFQVGKATQTEVNTAEQQVVQLQITLAGLNASPATTPVSMQSQTSSLEEQTEIQRIQTMIQNSPDLINAPDSHGKTPLEKAASNGWLKVAAFLLDHGADVNARGGLALDDAAMAGNRAMVEFLLSRGANVNANGSVTPLSMAAEKNFQAVAKVLIAHKADVNAADNYGETPLHLAVKHRQIKIVQMLLKAGANVNVENNEGRTPLSYAAENGSPEMVKMLLAAKADPNGGKLDTPLLAAIYTKNTNSTELLLQAGANPNLLGKGDWTVVKNGTTYTPAAQPPATPLYLAISTKQFPMTQLLLKYKADPNDSQTDGRSLLFSALDDTNILEALLDAGAKVDARDSTTKTGDNRLLNWTPLLLAVENNLPADLVEVLLKHGANPNLRDRAFGQTPLHWTVGWGLERLPNPKVVELLLDSKADPNARNYAGQTLLDMLKLYARQNLSTQRKTSLEEIITLLRQHGALDVLPDWNHITVSRPSANFSQRLFEEGTNDWNQVSLFDVLGVQYKLISGGTGKRASMSPYSHFAYDNSLAFPDLSNIIIRHPTADGKKWEVRKVNLVHALDSGDCSADVLLQWGDVVEIPEADHVINQRWTGLTTNQLMTLKHCLTRHLQITVNGRTTNFVVSPQVTIQKYWSNGQDLREISDGEGAPMGAIIRMEAKLLTGEPFMLWPVLNESKTLLASSDLSRVKIKRTDTTGKIHEWTVDCSNPNSPPNFWLRDGDVIEVPEK